MSNNTWYYTSLEWLQILQKQWSELIATTLHGLWWKHIHSSSSHCLWRKGNWKCTLKPSLRGIDGSPTLWKNYIVWEAVPIQGIECQSVCWKEMYCFIGLVPILYPYPDVGGFKIHLNLISAPQRCPRGRAVWWLLPTWRFWHRLRDAECEMGPDRPVSFKDTILKCVSKHQNGSKAPIFFNEARIVPWSLISFSSCCLYLNPTQCQQCLSYCGTAPPEGRILQLHLCLRQLPGSGGRTCSGKGE